MEKNVYSITKEKSVTTVGELKAFLIGIPESTDIGIWIEGDLSIGIYLTYVKDVNALNVSEAE